MCWREEPRTRAVFKPAFCWLFTSSSFVQFVDSEERKEEMARVRIAATKTPIGGEEARPLYRNPTPSMTTAPAAKVAINTNSMDQVTERPFQFLGLPAELRNRIYTLALTDDNAINLKVHQITESHPKQGERKRDTIIKTAPITVNTALLRLSKQVCAEARPLLYASNCFALEAARSLRIFLHLIRKRNVEHLRHIKVGGEVNTNGYSVATPKRCNFPSIVKLLLPATKLEVLELAYEYFKQGYRSGWELGTALAPLFGNLEEINGNPGEKRKDPMGVLKLKRTKKDLELDGYLASALGLADRMSQMKSWEESVVDGISKTLAEGK